MDDTRRARFITWFDENYSEEKGGRAKFIADSSRNGHAPLTKGRVSQFFDPDEAFGERAAKNLCDRFGLPDRFFEQGPAGKASVWAEDEPRISSLLESVGYKVERVEKLPEPFELFDGAPQHRTRFGVFSPDVRGVMPDGGEVLVEVRVGDLSRAQAFRLPGAPASVIIAARQAIAQAIGRGIRNATPGGAVDWTISNMLRNLGELAQSLTPVEREVVAKYAAQIVLEGPDEATVQMLNKVVHGGMADVLVPWRVVPDSAWRSTAVKLAEFIDEQSGSDRLTRFVLTVDEAVGDPSSVPGFAEHFIKAAASVTK